MMPVFGPEKEEERSSMGKASGGRELRQKVMALDVAEFETSLRHLSEDVG